MAPRPPARGRSPRALPQALGWHYLDSGALYRLTALAAGRAGSAGTMKPASRRSLPASTSSLPAAIDQLSGEESFPTPSAARKSPPALREWPRLPAVRAALLFRQRAFRRPPGLVADGRDMASVVFPDS
jgi:cytidylate kinase